MASSGTCRVLWGKATSGFLSPHAPPLHWQEAPTNGCVWDLQHLEAGAGLCVVLFRRAPSGRQLSLYGLWPQASFLAVSAAETFTGGKSRGSALFCALLLGYPGAPGP